ncbi:acyl-CoA dehydrogenase family protein [Amycolatopsis sp. FDAARGOS 1241]|uniref:acyl-CoA dehydrogenase family protein n=1 Tax=Amycolatopsis sp. FDAARGOS 1241 TaxID=2778070 RepID=UPI001EF2047A|nr:acyl-CoA dehydrogenase family protein [Amycolatopsis sp. FDAARGOS 1241]
MLTGRKNFATNTSVATHCSTTARYEDADGGPRLLLCQIALDQPGVRIHQTWDTMGMRGTQSNDVELTEVFVEDSAVMHSLPVKHLDARVLETVWAWAWGDAGVLGRPHGSRGRCAGLDRSVAAEAGQDG